VSRVRFGFRDAEAAQNVAEILFLQWLAHCFVPVSRL
jgi:hypothetical protein